MDLSIWLIAPIFIGVRANRGGPKSGQGKLADLDALSYVQSLLSKGAGIINGSHRDVSSDTGLKRLNQLIEIIEHIEHYNVPAFYLIDIIDQIQNIPGRGTINLGQKWTHRDRFLG